MISRKVIAVDYTHLEVASLPRADILAGPSRVYLCTTAPAADLVEYGPRPTLLRVRDEWIAAEMISEHVAEDVVLRNGEFLLNEPTTNFLPDFHGDPGDGAVSRWVYSSEGTRTTTKGDEVEEGEGCREMSPGIRGNDE